MRCPMESPNTDMKGWKEGPLPPNTWNWGGVTEKGDHPHNGFLFADFHGDHVQVAYPDNGKHLTPDQVGWYNNCIELPGW